jgi:hypothetical protein
MDNTDELNEALFKVIEKTIQINELKKNNVEYYDELMDLQQNYLASFIIASLAGTPRTPLCLLSGKQSAEGGVLIRQK